MFDMRMLYKNVSKVTMYTIGLKLSMFATSTLNQGYNLNKLGRGLPGSAKYQGSRPSGFRQEDF